MRKYLVLLFIITCFTRAFGQDTLLKVSPEQIEAIFLKENLHLIAERMNVDIADAEIAQAKLWENPNLSVGDVNLWSTESQRDGEEIPPLFGSFGKNRQFSLELSQLIQTARKRKKLVDREKVSKEMAMRQFEDVLRELKLELRKSVDEIIYLQSYEKVLDSHHKSLNVLVEAYKRQVSQGNLAKHELLRLQSSLLELENEMNEEKISLNEQVRILKSLLNVPPLAKVEIVNKNLRVKNPDNISIGQFMEKAIDNRPDIRLAEQQVQYFEKSLRYEKSLRTPDLTLSANYDRYGGVWKNFVSIGFSIDLPFFNRNQGGIKVARISRDQSHYAAMQQLNEAGHEIAEAYTNYTAAYKFYTKIMSDDLLSEIDAMFDIYTKNLLDRNISMLEYIDFVEAYKSNKQTVLSARKNVSLQFEELQYAIGVDIDDL